MKNAILILTTLLLLVSCKITKETTSKSLQEQKEFLKDTATTNYKSVDTVKVVQNNSKTVNQKESKTVTETTTPPSKIKGAVDNTQPIDQTIDTGTLLVNLKTINGKLHYTIEELQATKQTKEVLETSYQSLQTEYQEYIQKTQQKETEYQAKIKELTTKIHIDTTSKKTTTQWTAYTYVFFILTCVFAFVLIGVGYKKVKDSFLLWKNKRW
ncbi:hypothetical protein AXE80_10885 [Wenyingzhuangia fucanilytica]|uniref:Uncharacterized protein n=1 Tax=Wenyingzhuangia fucanilytica TaxID=1790137 RepID=A0A1B1Y7N6_9FLAO|nr:hypothetical protein [Wenyingzhuangia fucanilytica]ANW96749.1 hypothetical protein AXE80_10885 [Wenyingzhuangia fucanilytica]